MNVECPEVAFIIPAKNEETMLPQTLESIKSVVGKSFNYEIIVVDNGSSDETVSLAEFHGARVITKKTGSIGELRNYGVRLAISDIIVFIDADVSITDEWLNPFIEVKEALKTNPNMITGSRCSTDQSAGWIANSWFRQPPVVRQASHVGTGHMITSKQLFDNLDGFDVRLQSAEDFDFCSRAVKAGASVYDNHNLKVIHYGVPRSLTEFFRREVWHGAGDVTTLKTALNSKVTIMATIFLSTHLGIIAGVIYYPAANILFLVCVILILAICVMSAWKKYYYAPLSIILKNILLYYTYYWGRGVAVVNRILPILQTRSPRSGRSLKR